MNGPDGPHPDRTRRVGFVLLLDGPSGVGTSTTVAALQTAWPEVRPGPLLDLGLDHAFRAFGEELTRWWELIEAPEAHGNDVGANWGPLGREIVRTLPTAAAVWARQGWDVVIDHVLRDRATTHELLEALAGPPRLHVGLTCHPDVLEDRARSAGAPAGADLRASKALAELTVLESVADRDLMLDTTEAETSELVADILDAVRARLVTR